MYFLFREINQKIMGIQRKYLFKYISIISYLLKSCFNRTKSQVLLKAILHDLRVKILFGLEMPFKCVPLSILEILVTQSYDNKSIQEHNLEIHKCLFVSQEMLNKFKLKNMQWVLVNVMIKDSCSLPILHFNRIIVLNSFQGSECILTSTNLFNLCNCNNNCQVIMLRIIKPLIDCTPAIASKASISMMYPMIDEDAQMLLNKVFYNYFSLPKCVSVGDVFKLDIKRYYPEVEYLLKQSTISNVYFKIIELGELNKRINVYNCKNSFYISSSVTILNENMKCVTNTYLPVEKEYAINNLKNLNIDNYNDYILNVFPGGMTDYGKLLVSWIKPFIQQRDTGNFKLICFSCVFNYLYYDSN